jgi:hypothetical protein
MDELLCRTHFTNESIVILHSSLASLFIKGICIYISTASKPITLQIPQGTERETVLFVFSLFTVTKKLQKVLELNEVYILPHVPVFYTITFLFRNFDEVTFRIM